MRYMTGEEFSAYINEMPKYFVNISPQTDQEFDLDLLGTRYHFNLKWNAFSESSLRTPYNLDETNRTQRAKNLNTSGNQDTEMPGNWILDIYDINMEPLLTSISIVSGQELFDQFSYLELAGGLFAAGVDNVDPPVDYPDYNANGFIFWISADDLSDIAENITITD